MSSPWLHLAPHLAHRWAGTAGLTGPRPQYKTAGDGLADGTKTTLHQYYREQNAWDCKRTTHVSHLVFRSPWPCVIVPTSIVLKGTLQIPRSALAGQRTPGIVCSNREQ